MTSESFAADMGNLIGDGADLAPLMGAFSFTGRDPNQDDNGAEEEKSNDQQLESKQKDFSMGERETFGALLE